jgi:Fe-S-cluster-containing dehydrogenase component/CRP-like cAMP-binding protein
MPEAFHIVERPQRFDAAFDPNMADVDVELLLTIPPFSEMDPEKFPKRTPLREIIAHDTRIRRYRKGEIITRQGDYGTSAFMVLSGSVRVVLEPRLPASLLGRREARKKGVFRLLAQLWNGRREPESFRGSQLQADERLGGRQSQDEFRVFLQDVPRILDRHRTDVMGTGDFFGEIAALSRNPRTATIFADSDQAELLEIRWQGLRDLMKSDDRLRAHIDRIYRQRALASHLRAIPFFRHLTKEQLAEVAAQTEFATYGEYDWSGDYKRMAKAGKAAPEPLVATEGDYPNGVVLIRAGFARVSRRFGNGERTLNYLGAGHFFGFSEIAHNWRQPDSPVALQNSLRVLGYSHLLVVPTAVMEKVVLPTLPARELPALIDAEAAPAEAAPEARSDAGAGEKLGADLLEFITENRFFNGTATMLIDLDRCTRCDDCVRACASTHDNNPRFLRHGPTSGRIMVADACMHCADPVCMIGCPTGAIHRETFKGQVTINPATCIGCKMCASNCPYDAIRMVEIRDADGQFLLDQDLRPILKATKCDLCVENYGGPACQRACPHGALVRMNMNDLDTFAKWLKR